MRPPPTPLDDGAWCAALPKVELHLHLEGAIPLEALWTLLEKYGGDPAVPDPAALRARFAYRDFHHFIQTWVWKNRFLREAEDFTFIAEAVARDLESQGHLYVEAFCSPPDFANTGLAPQEILAALRRGLERVPGLRVALIPDLVRDSGPAAAARTLAQVDECRDLGVIGIGLGGYEAEFPPELFAAVFEEARRRGLHTSCHAGEAAGPASVRGALRVLRAERLGHAVRAQEDPALVDELLASATPLELCPISNLRTGAVASLEMHPALAWLRRGLRVCLNTDDPALFHTTLAGEFQAQLELGASRQEVLGFLWGALDSTWLPDEERRDLRARCQERLVELEAGTGPSAGEGVRAADTDQGREST